ncbi:MAG: TatD family hydrolase [Cyclobacteriaceae bacterium]|nr:TatD family hydrolase [Cyclobacteriaceae bacterium]
MKFWIDSHAHIYLKEFDHDRAEVLNRCTENNVQKIYMPNIDHTSIDSMLEVEAKNPTQSISMMGLHPCSVKKDFEKELYLVESWLSKRTFAAVGEIGTDLYWDKTYWEQQKEAFNIQIKWAKQYDLPVVIHCRDSMDLTIALVEALHDDKLKGVFHCFTGTAEQARQITKLGFYLGLGGVSTFKNGGMDKVIPELDINSILLETDSPYLSPVPYRGKRNEPSYIPIIAERVAELKKITLEELQLTTTSSAMKLFTQ